MGKWNWGAWPWTRERTKTRTVEFDVSVNKNGVNRKFDILRAVSHIEYVYGEQVEVKARERNRDYHTLHHFAIEIKADVEVMEDILNDFAERAYKRG